MAELERVSITDIGEEGSFDGSPPPTSSPRLPKKFVVAWYFAFKALPMLISAGTIYLGYDLFIRGVTGEASLSIESDTLSGQLINAAPGLFFAVGGLVALIFSIVKGVDLQLNRFDPTSLARDQQSSR